MSNRTPPLPGLADLAPGVWRRIDKDEPGGYLGSIHSDRFHHKTCHYVQRIRPDNQICFNDEVAAKGYGYIGCRRCGQGPKVTVEAEAE